MTSQLDLLLLRLSFFCLWIIIQCEKNGRNIKDLTHHGQTGTKARRDAEIKHYHCQGAPLLLVHVIRHLPVTKAISPCLTIDYRYALHITFCGLLIFARAVLQTSFSCWYYHFIFHGDEILLISWSLPVRKYVFYSCLLPVLVQF